MLLPLATAAIGTAVWIILGRLRRTPSRLQWAPFAGASIIFVLAFAGLAYSIFPYIVIDRLTIWEAAAHASSLKIVLVGTGIYLPLILGYTIFAHRIFWGKTKPAYH
jgi:cytochrome d ubiquinol oxidase subunit II